MANDVAGRVSSALAMELDRRLKKMIFGDENYTLGDATKRTIAGAIGTYTGKGTFGEHQVAVLHQSQYAVAMFSLT